MRRPVKPFVTEYKAPTRRQQQSPGSSQRRANEDFAVASSQYEPYARSGNHNAPAEDSYEAALRAADALFAPSVQSAKPAKTPPPEMPQFDDAAPQPVPDHPAETDAKGAGRILRAINEPVTPEAIDAEPIPKRRGRKPGSKNKPKVPPTSLVAPAPVLETRRELLDTRHEVSGTRRELSGTSHELSGTRRELLGTRHEDPDSQGERLDGRREPIEYPASAQMAQDEEDIEDIEDIEDEEIADETAPAIEPAGPAAAVPPARSPTPALARRAGPQVRFPWVRTKLAPGEQWKRRLPKVCW